MSAPAFPETIKHEYYGEVHVPGLTKREYAAIHIAAAIAGRKVIFTELETELAQRAVALADAVLREAKE